MRQPTIRQPVYHHGPTPNQAVPSLRNRIKRMLCWPASMSQSDAFEQAGLPMSRHTVPTHPAPLAPAAMADTAAPGLSPAMPPAAFHDSIIMLTDSYKVSHYKQYPPKTQFIYAYMESRIGAKFEGTVFFGLQYYLKRYLTGVRVTAAMVDMAEAKLRKHFSHDANCFNRAGWMHIVEAHGGRLPVRICALPEGTCVPSGNVMLTIENTDPKCFWLTNYLETLLTHVWYASTVATQSRAMKKTIKHYLEQTGGDLASLDIRLHDFGFRGVSSVESAAIGGAAHLVSFQGTDTLPAISLLEQYYHEEMAGISVPAAEHSTITSWGRQHELQAYANMLSAYPKGPIAVVSDSYDIYHACAQMWGKDLKEAVLGRDGVVVVRPDSGNPKDVVLRVHEILGAAFGIEINAKGYKQLPAKIAVIQGDGIDVHSVDVILGHLQAHGWATSGLSLGSGGGLLQKLNRDTQKVVFKASAAQIDGVLTDVYKDPVTDQGKLSKQGRLKLICESGIFRTVTQDVPGDNVLREVFVDGQLRIDDNLEAIRVRAAV